MRSTSHSVDLDFAREEAALAAFEVANMAVVLLDGCGEVLRTNPSADRMFGPDLQVSAGRIVSFECKATAAMEKSFQHLLRAQSRTAVMPPLALPRRDRLPLLAYLTRLDGVNGEAVTACQAVLVLIDPEQRLEPSTAAMKAAFNFSPAESRLATALVGGRGLSEAAESLSISRETARSQLRAIFLKTFTRKQSDLMVILNRMPHLIICWTLCPT